MSVSKPASRPDDGAGKDEPQRWLPQTPMSDPGREASMLNGLPDDIGGLTRVVQGLLLHLEWLETYGLTAHDFPHLSRDTLSVADRLRTLADRLPLHHSRAPAERSPGTCRDYSLMLCGLLRHRQIPARVRCGFASYFRAGRWEDHWICEAWLGGRWRRVDAQLDEILTKRLGVGFDPADLPSGAFMPAPEAWLRCRAGSDDTNRFGHGEEATGPWFMRVNVMRDHLVLNGAETSNWDTWRNTRGIDHQLSGDELRGADAIAADPTQPMRSLAPPWIA